MRKASYTRTIIKAVCMAFIALLFVAPHLQWRYKLVEVKPLDGSFTLQPEPEFSWQNWLNLDFQNATDKYVNEQFGFRNWLVRLYNQMAYSIFRQAKANSVLVGKQGYLMDNGYIQAYLGRSFSGKGVINQKTEKIKALQDELKASGTDLIVVFSPGKASFFSEYIPDRFNPGHKTLNNHDYFVQRCRELGINHIDFNTWFLQMKDTASYPLYPKTGVHWSYYGVALAADSLIRYIEHKRAIDIPDLYWSKVEVSDSLRDPDYDMAAGMNLIFKIPSAPMPYPEFKFRTRPGQVKPKVLTVSDSYYFQIHKPIRPHVFEDGGFWYYNEQVISDKHPPGTMVLDLNTRQELLQQDVVILMATELNLSNFPWGITERANQKSNAPKKKPFDPTTPKAIARIKELEKSILESPNWLLQVAEKARQQKLSLEEMVHNDAVYVAEMEYLTAPEDTFDPTHADALKRIKEIENDIRKSAEWTEAVARKAAAQGVAIDEMIRRDAVFMAEQEFQSK